MKPLYLPRSLRVGGGSLNALPAALAQLGLSRPMIVTDPFIAGNGVLDRVRGLLGGAVAVFDQVVPDPTVASILAGLEALHGGDHDCVIGLGGGSPIDSAKMIAVLAVHDTSPSRLRVPHVQDAPGLPIVAIPTTAGTGSEATRFSIVTDETTQEKMLCAGLAYLPTLAIVDYELTMSKPWRLTADTGIDAATHAIEAYVSRQASPFADGLALSALRAIWPNLVVACREPGHRGAREAMMLGSLQAGMAFSNASVALVHGMSRPIGAQFHVAHGLSNAMLLPEITRWSLPSATARYADCARAMGVVAADVPDDVAGQALVESLVAMNRTLEVPTPAAWGIDPAVWANKLSLMAEQALASGSPANNPRVPTHTEIEALYRAVFA